MLTPFVFMGGPFDGRIIDIDPDVWARDGQVHLHWPPDDSPMIYLLTSRTIVHDGHRFLVAEYTPTGAPRGDVA